MTNLNFLDRVIRAFFSILFLGWAFFWLPSGTTGQFIAYALGVILLATAVIKFCPIYRLIGLSTAGEDSKAPSTMLLILAWVVLAVTAVGGSYASNLLTRKAFLEDFNVMNDHYKQTLFLTGKNEREKANAKYDLLVPAYKAFETKYLAYQPFAMRADSLFKPDLQRVGGMLSSVNTGVRSGDLQQAHLDLEKVRPVFQEIFKRNGFSMLAVTLVDFHDAMELILDAAKAKNAASLTTLYTPVSDKLKAVEAEANDAEIQAIRKNLDDLLELAKAGRLDDLPAKGDQLKSSFVKVYLVRG